MLGLIYKILPKEFYRRSIKPRIRPLLLRRQKGMENSASEKEFISLLNRYKTNWKPGNKKVILTQIIEDHAYCIKIAACTHLLAKKEDANIGLYDAEMGLERNKEFNYDRWSGYLSERFTTRLDRIFLAFGGKVLYRNANRYSRTAQVESTFNMIRNKIKTNEDVLAIHIERIRIGDLVYDTYLRFANKPTVDVNDPFLDDVIRDAIHIYYVSKEALDTYDVKALVTSYVSYTKHGIVARLCLERNIPVYAIGAYYSLVHKVLKEYPSHSNDHFLFPQLFQQEKNKETILKEYRTLFEKRFEGQIDAATSYMKSSAFSGETNKELESIDWSNTIVLLAHCFFDSPHIYRDLLFPDFYEWITFSLDNLSKQKQFTVLVKQHPNGLAGNDQIFAGLKERYANSNIRFIDKKTSNVQIFQSKPKAILTAYGTAAAEFAYKGFPVLTVFDNPFAAYDFTYMARTKEEYSAFLNRIGSLEAKPKQEQIIEYYYMQHFFFLGGRNVDYLGFMKYKGETYSDVFLADYMPRMNEEYFKQLEQATNEGFEMIRLEEERVGTR
ncbi:MAG: hypothetical protein ACJ77K_07055 [Bacteroidia bacterium]